MPDYTQISFNLDNKIMMLTDQKVFSNRQSKSGPSDRTAYIHQALYEKLVKDGMIKKKEEK